MPSPPVSKCHIPDIPPVTQTPTPCAASIPVSSPPVVPPPRCQPILLDPLNTHPM
ncbi:hypothetical protein A2U01_0116315, partial [Trifolium medium]|nr:hypothetical protein [Trifolium medium]